jgi:SpoVK/Ycf46/Vps4 family AAA+-type ATPase
MVQKKDIEKTLYHIIRLAVEDKREDLEVYLKRNQKILKEHYPDLGDDLEILKKNSTNVFRNTKMANIPVDLDSRLELVRIFNKPSLDFDPIWDDSIYKIFNQVILERTQKIKLKERGLVATKSIIFTGKPGVGKSLAAKWIAFKLNKPLLILDLSAVMSSFLGRTGSNLRNVLDYAKGMECVLLLDEIDAIAKKRDDNADVGELKRLVTVILQEIDEWPEHSLLIAATNHSSLLDPAVWRRFDLEIEFPMPSTELVSKVVDLYLGKEKIESKEVKNYLISLLDAFSFSDIERAVLSIRKQAVIKKIRMDDAVVEYFTQHVSKLDKESKLKVAKLMVSLGSSQRGASETVKISRTTLSKKIKG